MATPVSVQPLVMTAVGLLIAWRLFSRVRRAIGRQRFSATRSWVSIILYPIVGIALLSSALFRSPLQSLWEVAGWALGTGLAIYSLKKSTFENVDGKWYYTPHAPIGIALSLLLVARVAWRLISIYTSTEGFTHQPAQDFVRSPLTLAIVGTLFGYYFAYSIGLLKWRHTGNEAPASAAAPPD